ncbi:NlpC/P60 family protein [Asticcacaulis sp. ZE23SCel15]|uniref:C40 family peptidase n=1 Tax=Asticcacaulis sp. ZE23SCel15 TaxID=3059027 RepID=UPI0026601340|nr:NlpC/P60 family protein [Asticcacaulis sp. ZE23SCel15]WKL57895.1 NlpC/P60 family protein [Asticcacaulis sp. ZE23SCel15]
MAHERDPRFDPRLTPYKDGVAEIALQGVITAARYVVGELLTCNVTSAAMSDEPGAHAEQSNQILFGERFKVIERKHDYVWGQSMRDGYVGYVHAGAFTSDWHLPTHFVSTLRTFVFADTSIKSAIKKILSLNSLVSVTREEGKFSFINDLGWVYTAHLSGFDRFADDYVDVAETFLHAPYQWGGRESIGVDCSGLVQQAIYATGRSCPRDTYMQAAELGDVIEIGPDFGGLERGDLVFWKGHVAIMMDAETIIHANAFHMKTAIKSLKDAVARIEASGNGLPTVFRRL